ncbi:MAG TPA: diphthine--ammonia ligase [Chitinophagaceae bacterium]|jgi:uncharacterized protein (TIGR00290 family)|nr:diphthine--ammonia ligase [Chitinophagaceae bacterium]
MTRAYFNWSGGKDSAFALWKVLKEKRFNVEYLLTSMNSFHDRVSMHGVRRSLLEVQASSLNIPLTTIELAEEPSMSAYEAAMMNKVNWLKELGIIHSIFGDIFLEDLKIYREKKLATAGIQCVFPIWKRDTKRLVKEFVDENFKAVVVCVNEKFLDKSFCGMTIDQNFIDRLPLTVDPCGENGEFHSFVYDGPIFTNPIPVIKGEIVYKKYKSPDPNTSLDGFYFCDLLIDQ